MGMGWGHVRELEVARPNTVVDHDRGTGTEADEYAIVSDLAAIYGTREDLLRHLRGVVEWLESEGPKKSRCKHKDRDCSEQYVTVCKCGAMYDEGWVGETPDSFGSVAPGVIEGD